MPRIDYLLYIMLSCITCYSCAPRISTTTISNVIINYNEDSITRTAIRTYSMVDHHDTIDFIVSDTSFTPKPIFLFIQGSGPVPLVVDYGSYYGGLYANHMYLLDTTIHNNFHVVEISMPYTPIVVSHNQLGKNCYYYPTGETNVFAEQYRLQNQRENYVKRVNKVVSYLISQKWVKEDSIVIFGHSQGAEIVPYVALSNKHIKAVGISGNSPLGRTKKIILTARCQAMQNLITEQEAFSLINKEYNNWAYCRDTTDQQALYRTIGDLPSTWLSFSQSTFDVIAKLKQPVFIAYGTRDYWCLSCELLPLYFISHRKTNYCIYPLPGYGHNYEPVDLNGNRIAESSRWHDVTANFIRFINGKHIEYIIK